VLYSDINDNEVLGTNSELLRVCFRMCLGILDKIAVGICKFFCLDHNKESIYFESFWKSKEARWKKLNEIFNYPLFALYCQATDLNTNKEKKGELSFFKEYRNKLEHSLLILVNDDAHNSDQFQSDESILHVNYGEFKEKTLHLLQFTRSAIFNFAFMVRLEIQNIKKKNSCDI